MPSIFTPTPSETERKEPGIGGKPPVDRRPTGAAGGGDDEWKMNAAVHANCLNKVRFFVCMRWPADMIFFAVLVLFFFAQAGFHWTPDARVHRRLAPVLLPKRSLYLNTVLLF